MTPILPILRLPALLALLLLTSCKFVGDGIANLTDKRVLIRVEYVSGHILSHEFFPGMFARAPKGAEYIYYRVEAFGPSGEKIGELQRNDLIKPKHTYGKHLSLIVVDEGVFPVPREYSATLQDLRKNKSAIITAFRKAQSSK